MWSTTPLSLVFVLFINSVQNHSLEGPKSYKTSHLLKAMLSLEINLSWPDLNSISKLYPSLPEPLLESVEYLVTNSVPYGLLSNSTKTPQPYITARSSRYTENLAVQLVFLTIHSEDEWVDLKDVLLKCCSVGATHLFARQTIDRSFVLLVVDESAVTEGWNRRFEFKISSYCIGLSKVSGVGVMLIWYERRVLVMMALP